MTFVQRPSAIKNKEQRTVRCGMLSIAMSPYLMLTTDITVMASDFGFFTSEKFIE